MPVKKALLCLAALAVTVLAIHLFPHLPVSPPAPDAPERRLITLWAASQLPGGVNWLKKQAAAYGRQQKNAALWLRIMTEQEMAAAAETPPDAVIWSAGVRVPEALGAADAVPLCLSGYVLAQPRPEAAATPAPRSLFGVSPTPDPAQTPVPALVPWPETFWADDGFGALALRAMNAPAGAQLIPRAQLPARFQAGEAALLSVSQLQTQPAAYDVVAAAPATDLVLYGAAISQTARDFLDFLRSQPAQTALSAHGLLPVLPGLRLYGPDFPALSALQYALDGGWLAPPDWSEKMAAETWVGQWMYERRNWQGEGDVGRSARPNLRQRDFIPLESQRANQLELTFKQFPPVNWIELDL